jgi:hypothetical protein
MLEIGRPVIWHSSVYKKDYRALIVKITERGRVTISYISDYGYLATGTVTVNKLTVIEEVA